MTVPEFNDSLRCGLNSKNASRKADREAIARALCAIAAEQGAEIRRKESGGCLGFCGKGIDLRFSLNGVGAMIDVDNLHGGQFAIISWFNDGSSPCRNFSDRFNRCVGDLPLGRVPHHKASSVPADWYSAAMFLSAGLMLAARGEAFVEEAKAA
jgi:hypothetical protein